LPPPPPPRTHKILWSLILKYVYLWGSNAKIIYLYFWVVYYIMSLI
jgi:hypothetical protein